MIRAFDIRHSGVKAWKLEGHCPGLSAGCGQ